MLALGLGTASAGEPGLALDPGVSAEIAGAKTASVAVSAKGRVSLAIATEADLQHWDWTHAAAGPQRRWATATKFAARGEDRPQVGFAGEHPWIVGLKLAGHEVAVYWPERSPFSADPGWVNGYGPGPQGAEPECVVAVAGSKQAISMAWTTGGSLRYGWLTPPPGALGGETVRKSICPCCRPGVAAAPDGATFLAFRDERETGDTAVRDIYLLAQDAAGDLWGEPVRVAKEGWSSDACPMAGPAVIALPERRVVVAYVVPGAEPQLKVARSLDGGASFGDAARVATGRKPQLCAIGARGVLLVYDGKPDGVYAALSADGGATFAAPVRVDVNASGVASGGAAVSAAPDKKSAYVSWIDTAGEKRTVCVRRVALKE